MDRTAMQGILTDYLSLYETFDKDHKRQLNQILFSVIISYLKAGSTEGEIELRIRGNGVITKAWEDIKKGNQKVRTSGSLGFARHTKTQTALCSTPPSKSAIPPVARRRLQSQNPHILQFSLFLSTTG